MVDVLWHRSRGDYELHAIALELLFEVCRSERLSEEDLGTKSALIPSQACFLSKPGSLCGVSVCLFVHVFAVVGVFGGLR